MSDIVRSIKLKRELTMIQYNEPDAEIKELWSKAHSNYYVFAQLLVERMNKKAFRKG